MTATIADLERMGVLDGTDVRLARSLCRLSGEASSEEVLLAVALASRQVGAGHVCLDLSALPSLSVWAERSQRPVDAESLVWPDISEWRSAIAGSALVEEIADARDPERLNRAAAGRRPLILDPAGRLYLRRYFEHEAALAADLNARASELRDVDEKVLA
jgi:exodeoxyribonuclease V alpha subunit